MLRNVNDLYGFSVAASDGPIGDGTDCYFDDRAWTIGWFSSARYCTIRKKPGLSGHPKGMLVRVLRGSCNRDLFAENLRRSIHKFDNVNRVFSCAAFVAISQLATVVTGALTYSAQDDFASFTASMLLAAFSILAPIFALVLVLATRCVASRVRIGVTLLVLASAVSALRGVIDTQPLSNFLPWPLTPGTLVYPVAIVLIIFASVTLRRQFLPLKPNRPPQPQSRLLLFSVSAGLLVAAAVALGFAHAVATWAARPPLLFGLAFTESNRAAFEDWLTLQVQSEDLISIVLGVWLAIGIIGALILALSGLSRWMTIRRLITVSLGALCLFLLSYGSVLGFLNMASNHVGTTAPVELLLLIGRWGLVVAVLVMVGGMRGRSTSRVAARA